MLGKSSKAGEGKSLRVDQIMDMKNTTGLKRHVNRLVNTRFLPFKPSFYQVSATRQRAL
ncbi:hypothetical protein DPMN_054086 [Dreissena polymorpha]|uniref:Uncharacterized protein n=1 Tax=Dreissena polymorpha TaxID=45954 RepID=A0A9D4HQX0_DREPO|nr:hypothetical protein DPMN_054086 [Dreissena polymorpha]